MDYFKRSSGFDTFFDNRDSLIVQFKNGEISKREFLQFNFDFVQSLGVKPFDKIDSFEKGMYNYQYFNTLAKYYSMMGVDLKREGKDYKYFKDYLNKANYFYNEKDKSTLKLLRFLEFKNTEAYFIRVESEKLKNKLFEVVLTNYEYAIFHSKSNWLLKILRDKKVFIEEKKLSLIDEYINEKY